MIWYAHFFCDHLSQNKNDHKIECTNMQQTSIIHNFNTATQISIFFSSEFTALADSCRESRDSFSRGEAMKYPTPLVSGAVRYV